MEAPCLRERACCLSNQIPSSSKEWWGQVAADHLALKRRRWKYLRLSKVHLWLFAEHKITRFCLMYKEQLAIKNRCFGNSITCLRSASISTKTSRSKPNLWGISSNVESGGPYPSEGSLNGKNPSAKINAPMSCAIRNNRERWRGLSRTSGRDIRGKFEISWLRWRSLEVITIFRVVHIHSVSQSRCSDGVGTLNDILGLCYVDTVSRTVQLHYILHRVGLRAQTKDVKDLSRGYTLMYHRVCTLGC